MSAHYQTYSAKESEQVLGVKPSWESLLSKTRKSEEERTDMSDTVTLKEDVSRVTCRCNT